MQRLEVSGAVRPIYGSLGVKRLNKIGFVGLSLAQTNGHQTATCQIPTACLRLIMKSEVYVSPLVLKFKAISSL